MHWLVFVTHSSLEVHASACGGNACTYNDSGQRCIAINLCSLAMGWISHRRNIFFIIWLCLDNKHKYKYLHFVTMHMINIRNYWGNGNVRTNHIGFRIPFGAYLTMTLSTPCSCSSPPNLFLFFFSQLLDSFHSFLYSHWHMSLIGWLGE